MALGRGSSRLPRGGDDGILHTYGGADRRKTMRRRLHAACLGLAIAVFGTASPAVARERGRGRRRADNSPRVGSVAPDFELVTVKWLMMSDREKTKAKAEVEARRQKAGRRAGRAAGDAAGADAKPGHVKLSSFRGKRPVVFVLTSYT